MLPAKHPHTITSMLHNGNHTCGDYLAVGTKFSNLESSDQRTDFHRSNIHCSCFLAQASLSCPSVVVSLHQSWRPDSLLLLEICEAIIWDAIWGAVNCRFLRLVTLMNLSSAAEVILGLPFLWRSSWELDGFWDCTWRIFKSYWKFPDWLTFMS